MPRVQELIVKNSGLPRLGTQEHAGDPIVHVKLFTPYSSWTWLLLEHDPQDGTAFAYAYDATYPQGAELGYIDVAELQAMRTRWGGQQVERDVSFLPCPLSVALRAKCPGARPFVPRSRRRSKRFERGT